MTLCPIAKNKIKTRIKKLETSSKIARNPTFLSPNYITKPKNCKVTPIISSNRSGGMRFKAMTSSGLRRTKWYVEGAAQTLTQKLVLLCGSYPGTDAFYFSHPSYILWLYYTTDGESEALMVGVLMVQVRRVEG